MLGAKESLDQTKFTPEGFQKTYSAFIKEMQSLPSKPEMVLISPIYSSKTVLATNEPFKMNELDGEMFEVGKSNLGQWQHAKVDMSALVAKVAQETGVPKEQVIDSERYIRYFTSQNAMVDSIHPNEVGYGALA